MKHRVYLRDWYFNAGIAGFVRVILDGNPQIEENNHFSYDDNYISFDPEVLHSFKDTYIKQAFYSLFRIKPFLSKLDYIAGEIEKDTKGKKKTTSFLKLIGKSYERFYSIMKLKFSDKDADSLKESLQKAKSLLEEYKSEEKLFNHFSSFKAGNEYIRSFVTLKLKGIASIEKLETYKAALNKVRKQPVKEKDICLFCQERKAEFDFNNAVSNIVGFNNDNANWVWGYRTQNLRLCGVCALIYSCAILSFGYVVKLIDSDYRNYLYFINHNTSVRQMYEEISRFKELLKTTEFHSFYEMIKETITIIQTQHMKKIDENINFLEIVDNPILGGQSTKGYNIYNYNIDKYIAMFLKEKLPDHIPRGYYKINKISLNLDEELLRLTITNQLNYNVLNRYIFYRISKSTSITAVFNISRVTHYIIDYLNEGKGRPMQEILMKIYKKGFRSGITLKSKLVKAKKENQINGIVYGLLNSLKIADKEKFMDKYIRLIMAHEMPMSFSKDEMTDKDCFLQFGYSFINGLLAEGKKEDDK